MPPNSVYERRRANLAARLREAGAKQALAMKLKMTPPQISHWLRDPEKYGARKITEDSARDIERVLGLTLGELDGDSGARPPAPPPALGKGLDFELLTQTVQHVLLEVGRIKGQPMAEKVAGIVALAFAHATDHGALDIEYVHSLVRLMY